MNYLKDKLNKIKRTMAEIFKTDSETKGLKGLTPKGTIELDDTQYNRPAVKADNSTEGKKARKKLRKAEYGITGHMPENKEVVQINYENRVGIAVMRDESHFYVSMGIFNDDSSTVTIMDEHPLGLEPGLLPMNSIVGQISSKNVAHELVGKMLLDKFGEEMGKYDALQKQIEEELERKAAEAKRKADEERERKEREAVLAELVERDKEMQDLLAERIDPMEHLNYLRGEKDFLDMSYPFINRDGYPTSQVYFTMSHVIRIFEIMQRFNAITYRYSRSYYEELMSRAKAYNTSHTMKDFVNDNDQQVGILILPPKEEGGESSTLFYDIYKTGTITGGYFCLIKANRLVSLYHFKQDEKKFVDEGDHLLSEIFWKDRESPMRKADVRRMFMRIVISHLCMEQDAENIIDKTCYENKVVEEEDIDTKVLHTEGLVVERNEEWYTTLYIQNEIPVQGYLSHRWFNNPNGEGKVLREVSVRAHSRHGYTRTAKVLNQED